MNRKQKLSLVGGVVALALGAINALTDFYRPGFDIWLVFVVLVTGALIYHFKGKDEKQV